MSSNKYNAVLTGLLCVALGGCSSMTERSASTDTSERASDLYGATSLSAPAAADASDAATSGSAVSSTAGTQMSSQMAPPATQGAAGMTTGPVAGTADGSTSTATTQAGMATYGVVQSIDQIPRSQVASAELSASGLSTSAGSSTAGTSSGASDGSAATASSGDMVYRVMVRLDDGSMRPAYQESQPTYQIGDRVRMANGMVLRY